MRPGARVVTVSSLAHEQGRIHFGDLQAGQSYGPFVRRIGQSAARGALPSLYAATAPEVVGGGFYGPNGPGQLRGKPTRVLPASGALDEQVAQQLGEVSERLTGVRFQWVDPSADRAPDATEGVPDTSRPS
jgi:hypothetical protein